MAIFNMSDSSLNKYLNENGGAHKRYVQMQDKKVNDHLDKHDRYADSIDKDIKNKSISQKTYENVEKRNTELNKAKKAAEEAKKYRTTGYGNSQPYYSNGLKEKKKEFQKNFGGKSKDTINTNDRKPGTYLEKQKKLREAAEYILSVLDEMNTIEDLENQKKMIMISRPENMKEKIEEINKKIKIAKIQRA